MMNRVVITGLGIYSCIGKNLAEVRDSLYHGKSGIVLDQARKEMGYRSGLTGHVEKPLLKGVLDRRARIMLPEQGEFAYMATSEALHQAAIDQDLEDNWAVVAEAIQTILRKEGYPNPYEALKELTRKNEKITQKAISTFIDGLKISDALKAKLKAITPFNYTGV